VPYTDDQIASVPAQLAAEGQEIVARNFYRPRDQEVVAAHASAYPKLELFTIDQQFGGWTKAQQIHFADGGEYDRLPKGP